MRNYSKEPLRNCLLSYSPAIRTVTSEKRNSERINLREGEVRIGKYKYDVSDELGKGFSSKVYKAVEIEKIHKRYAIKVIDLRKFRGENIEMLEAEIQIQQNLNHENIVKLFEVIRTANHYYLVLEYCPHGNLLEYIRQKRNISESSSIQIMSQIINAYKYLISECVLHRDIKPANVLRVGNKWKISDFGFAVRAKQGFRERMNVGTPLYMSPETYKKNSYSCKSDIFSLGILLYEMVEGVTPWESLSSKDLNEKKKIEITVPTHLKNIKIREFILHACQINDMKRMTKQQFLNFQLNSSHSDLSDHEHHGGSNSISPSQKSISTAGSTDGNPKSPHSQPENIVAYNRQLFAAQQIFIECLHNLYLNIESFELEDTAKQMLMLTAFKLVLRLSRLLSDRSNNNLKYKNWEEFKLARCFQENIVKASSVSQNFEKEYLQFIKHNDIKVIRAVNRKFPELCQSSTFLPKFYENLKSFLVSVIKQHNQQVLKLSNQGCDDLNDRYQALQCLYQIYRQVQFRISPELQQFCGGHKMKLISDYTQSTLNKNDYLDLRRLLRNIC